jgi:hypothetical protein
MKKVMGLLKYKNYKISFEDKSGNWIGGFKRNCVIIINYGSGLKKCSSVSEAVRFLS